MKNLTLALDEEVLLSARKLALDRNTTVNQLVREYLERLVEEQGRQKKAALRLEEKMKAGVFVLGEIDWNREDLYER